MRQGSLSGVAEGHAEELKFIVQSPELKNYHPGTTADPVNQTLKGSNLCFKKCFPPLRGHGASHRPGTWAM